MDTRQEIERFNQRLDRSVWSLVAILTGCVLLRQAPVGVWLIGTAVMLLAMNLIRLSVHIPMSILTLMLGATMLVMGLGFTMGVHLFLIPLLLIVGGFVALLKTLSYSRIVD